MTITGFQASGKSTIAKAVYYFRTVKEDIVKLIETQVLTDDKTYNGFGDNIYAIDYGEKLAEGLKHCLMEKFIRTFGGLSKINPDEMYLEYYYTESCYIKIFADNGDNHARMGCVCVLFSEELKDFLDKNDRSSHYLPSGLAKEELLRLTTELYELFADKCYVVYIPAGRSMISLLSQQFNYFYLTMDDMQKRLMDKCTRDYLELILRLKPELLLIRKHTA